MNTIRRGTSAAASTTCACSHSLAGGSRMRPRCRNITRAINLQFVTVAEIAAARERIRPAAVYTPLIEVQAPRPSGPQALFLKCENLQPMGAFKIRGAYNMISQLPKEQLDRGVITYSSGNHGQAVALAAQKLGARAVIVMPTTAPQVKIDGCKSYGAEVIMAGTTSIDRQTRAEQEARSAA